MESPDRNSLLIVASALVLGIASIGIDAEDASPETKPWKALAASGSVEARPVADVDSAWGRVVRGDELAPRTLVRTGRRGRTTLARHASVLMVDPQSQLELPAVVSAGGDSSVIQTSGSVVYEVDGRKVDDFKVVTPYLVAGVKGTVFLVTVTDRHASVTVERGTVEVTSVLTGETTSIRAGQTVLVDEEEQEAMEVHSLRAEGHGMERETRKLVRAENRRLARIVGDTVIAVPELDLEGTEGVKTYAERDLLGQDEVFADETKLDPAETTPTDPINEWTEDEKRREEDQRQKQATPTSTSANPT